MGLTTGRKETVEFIGTSTSWSVNSKLLKKRKQLNLEHKILGISLTDMKALGLSVRDWLVRREPGGF